MSSITNHANLHSIQVIRIDRWKHKSTIKSVCPGLLIFTGELSGHVHVTNLTQPLPHTNQLACLAVQRWPVERQVRHDEALACLCPPYTMHDP